MTPAMNANAQAAAAWEREMKIRPDFAELGRVRSFAELAAAELELPAAEAYEFKLAASEAAANAIEHGRPCRGGFIRVWVSLGEEGLKFGVRDCGSFSPGRPSPGEGAERGRGLTLIATLMDELTVKSGRGQTVLELTKRRPGCSAASR